MVKSSGQFIDFLKVENPQIAGKVSKIMDSHGQFKNYADFFISILQKEEDFLKAENMPQDWTSHRAYASGFEALTKAVILADVQEYLLAVIGEDQFIHLKKRLEELKRSYNVKAKQPQTTQSGGHIVGEGKVETLVSFINGLIQSENDPVKAYLMQHSLDLILSS